MASQHATRLSIFSSFFLAASTLAAADRPDTVPGRYLVQLAPGSDALAFSRAAATKGARAVSAAGDVVIVEGSVESLGTHKQVQRIEPVYQGGYALARAVQRSNIAAAWTNGAANAGRGMRIAIIDSGIDAQHPAFQTTGMTPPEGFPRTRHQADLAATNNKIIVVRNYQDILKVTRPTPLDTAQHGTSTAAAAAAVEHNTPYGAMSGAAPGAYLGIYKVGPNGAGAAWQTDAVLLAIHDAINDGMDVISLSLGFTYGTPYGDTLLSEAIEKAERAGIIVVGAAGNAGPNPRTIGAISVTDAMITTGAVESDRRFVNAIRAGTRSFLAIAGEGANGMAEIAAPVADAGLACLPLPSMNGRIAIIERGGCLFTAKLQNAFAAGARAAVIYTEGDPFPLPPAPGRLPAMMVTAADGQALKATATATLDFRPVPQIIEGERVAAFSARGPGPLTTIEPDVAAVGESMLLPVSGGGYQLLNGTSFSAPLLAGAAAVLKQQRPGLTPAQYRSLLVNTARPVAHAKPQEAGAGLLDLTKAMASPITANVTSTVFGISYNGALNTRRDLTLTNLGSDALDVPLAVEALEGDSAPVLDAASVHLAPGGAARVTLRWNALALAPGAYQGFLHAGPLRIAYWAAVPTDRPAAITALHGGDTWPVEDVVAFIVQVTDAAGLLTGAERPLVIPVEGPVTGQTLQVTPLNGQDGNYFVLVQLDSRPGVNQFRLQAGGARATVAFAGVE